MIAMNTDPTHQALLAFIANHPWTQNEAERNEATRAAVNAKDRERQAISDQVQAFIQSGGTIKNLAEDESHHKNQPIKRTKREQIKYKKRFNKIG